MTLTELENLMGRAGLTQHQTRELLPAIHAYATEQATKAAAGFVRVNTFNAVTGPGSVPPDAVWHALTLTPEVGSRCGAVGVNTTNTRLVNCPDCLKAGAG